MTKEDAKIIMLVLVPMATIIFIITFAYFVITFMKQEHEAQMIQATCYMYLKNGVPDTIEIYNTTYRVNEKGEIPKEDMPFVNPYHAAELAMSDCIRVNIKKENFIEKQGPQFIE